MTFTGPPAALASRYRRAASTSSGVVGTNVYRATASGGPYAQVALLTNTTGYTDNQVNARTSYYYVVRAVRSGVESGASNEATVMTR